MKRPFWEAAEEFGCRGPAPEGASDSEQIAVSLKRYPDTKPKRYRDTKPEFSATFLRRSNCNVHSDESFPEEEDR
jgi:hypothetical protein